MVAEITQAQNNAVVNKTQEPNYEQFSNEFAQKLLEKLDNKAKTIVEENSTKSETAKTTDTKAEAAKTKESTSTTENTMQPKSRAEQMADMLREMLQNAIAESKTDLTEEKINKMSLDELKSTAKSVMKDATDFISLANLLPIMATIPDDCGACFTYDDKGKVVNYKIFRPDGTVIQGNMTGLKDSFTEEDLDKIIEQMKFDQLKNFCLKGANPLEAFESILGELSENSAVKQDSDLNEKIKATQENAKDYKSIFDQNDTAEDGEKTTSVKIVEKLSALGIKLTKAN